VSAGRVAAYGQGLALLGNSMFVKPGTEAKLIKVDDKN